MSDQWPRRAPAPSPAARSAPSGGPDDLVTVLDLLGRHTELELWVLTLPGERTRAKLRGHLTVPAEVLEWAEWFCAHAVQPPESTTAPDVTADPQLRSFAESHEFAIGAFVGIPLLGPDHSPLGSICGISAHPVDSDLSVALELVEGFTKLIASRMIIERRLREAEQQAIAAVEQGHRDSMTGVLNRAGWDAAVERVGERCREGDAASVIVADLDELKVMNDRFGHAYGDEQIRTMAVTIRGAARADDVVARLGGDEFGLLMPGSAPGTAEAMARRLQEQTLQRRISASIGSAECPPGGDLVEAWRRADMDMYATKRLTRRKPDVSEPVGTETAQDPEDSIAEIVAAARLIATAPLRVIRNATRPPQ